MITPEQTIDRTSIKEWALIPENLDRAVALGKRLIGLKHVNELQELESLGDFEDQASEWAVHNQLDARLLVLQLLPALKKKLNEREEEE